MLVEVPEAVVRTVGTVRVCDPDVTDELAVLCSLGDALVSVLRVLPAVAEGSEPVMLLGRSVSVGVGPSVTAANVASVALGSVPVVGWMARDVDASGPLSAGGEASPAGASVGDAPASGVVSPAAAAAAADEPQ